MCGHVLIFVRNGYGFVLCSVAQSEDVYTDDIKEASIDQSRSSSEVSSRLQTLYWRDLAQDLL